MRPLSLRTLPDPTGRITSDDCQSKPARQGMVPEHINGNRKRGTGILNNELYVGFLVWNRLSVREGSRN